MPGIASLALSGALLLLASGVAALGGVRAGIGPWPAAVVAVLGTLWLAKRRPRTATLPSAARAWFTDHVPLYAAADAHGRARFETVAARVLAGQRFEAVGDAAFAETAWTDERRWAVAAGMATMLAGRPSWAPPTRRTMLLYAERFDSAYVQDDGEGEFDGMAHPQGPVIFAADALDAAWTWPDGQNVVLHELAHLFDYQVVGADGVPSLLDPASADAWVALVRRETQRIRVGKSLLRGYAATNPAEFFAVGTEVFFERPHALARRHPDVFAAFEAMYAVDPRPAVAAFADAHADSFGADSGREDLRGDEEDRAVDEHDDQVPRHDEAHRA